MTTKTLVAAFAAASLLAGQVLAAGPTTVSTVKGDVTIIGAKGVTAAAPGAVLRAGDRIVTRGGQAGLRYADGCVVAVKANAMVTVASASPCAGGKGVVATQPANAAQWWKIDSLDGGTIVAGVGATLLIGAVIYGLTDPTKCHGTLEVDGRCTPSP